MEIGRKISLLSLFRFAFSGNTLLIFSPHYTEKDMRDGYMRRVAFCDGLLSERKRIVMDLGRDQSKTEIVLSKKNKVVVTFSRSRIYRMFVILVLLLIKHDVYCESVWQVKKYLFLFPFLRLYVDVHGAVPEEEFLYRKFESSQLYTEIEEKLIKKESYLFCVTESMIRHLQKKYGTQLKSKMYVLPIIDKSLDDLKNIKSIRKKERKKPTIIYAGGIFKWQNIETMCNIIKQVPGPNYEIYTPGVRDFWKIFGKEKRNVISKAESVNPEYLKSCAYPNADYGFVLRDDIVVNNVACPTKINEYLEYGIIPIVKSENIGDFVSLGMKYISMEKILKGELYSYRERQEIIKNNLECLKKYYSICEEGIKQFKKIML